MNKIRYLLSEQDASCGLTFATVLETRGTACKVEYEGQVVEARVARGCLVKVQSDDLVLVAVNAQHAYVMDVLESHASGPTPLHFEQGVEIEAGQAGVNIRTSGDMQWVSPQAVNVTTMDYNVTANHANHVCNKMDINAVDLHADVTNTRVRSNKIEMFIDRIHQRLKESIRWISGQDTVNAKKLHYTAKETMMMRSKNGVMLAEDNMKIDADQIHLG